jgi:hypothetical protein
MPCILADDGKQSLLQFCYCALVKFKTRISREFMKNMSLIKKLGQRQVLVEAGKCIANSASELTVEETMPVVIKCEESQ